MPPARIDSFEVSGMDKKQSIVLSAGAVGMLILILEARTAAAGIRDGIEICLYTLIPALFPFMILSGVLTNAVNGHALSWMEPLCRICRIPNGSQCLLLIGLLGGYPIGAQNVEVYRLSGRLTEKEAQRMQIFCNNAGPAFLFGMLGSMFDSNNLLWLLWLIQIASAILTSILLPGGSSQSISSPKSSSLSITQIMSNSTRSMGIVCGWVVLFRMILLFLQRWFLWLLPVPIQVLLTGIIELSNGCIMLRSIEQEIQRFLLVSVLLPFGGLCVTMQTASICSKWKFSVYLQGKILQSTISFLLAIMLILTKEGYPIIILPVMLLFLISFNRIRAKKEVAI